jgi:DNA-directed RNA polymerase specialized sigma24 family protein
MEQSAVKIDALLEPLLLEVSEKRADDLLLQLIAQHVEPIIKAIIRHKLRLGSQSVAQRAEADDLYQDVLLQLLGQVRQFRTSPEQHPIGDLCGLSAIIAHRTCSRWMRRQFPERHTLKNRLHYLLTRQRGFALWQDNEGNQVAGFEVWQQQGKATAGLTDATALAQVPNNIGPPQLAVAVATILNSASGPVEFDELVSALAERMGVRDQPIASLSEDEDAHQLSTTGDQAWRLEKKLFLQRLWDELQLLPVNQRIALLLNLKDAGGGVCITLFCATGIASLRQLAETLELSSERFAELWNELPLEDARIAELLGVTRQQVINARKSGRERLARRLKGFM